MVLLSSLLGGPVGMSAYVAAVHYAGPALASAVSALFPAVGALLAWVLLKERLRKVQVLGLSVSVTGVALLGLGYGPEGGKNVPLGFVFALICCVSWALETVLFSWGIRRTGLTLGQALLLRQTVSAAACGGIILPLLRGWEETLSVLPVFHRLLPLLLPRDCHRGRGKGHGPEHHLRGVVHRIFPAAAAFDTQYRKRPLQRFDRRRLPGGFRLKGRAGDAASRTRLSTPGKRGFI